MIVEGAAYKESDVPGPLRVLDSFRRRTTRLPFLLVLGAPSIDIDEPPEDARWVISTLVWEREDRPLMDFRVRLNRDYN